MSYELLGLYIRNRIVEIFVQLGILVQIINPLIKLRDFKINKKVFTSKRLNS